MSEKSYTMQQLQEYLVLTTHLSGEEPKSIYVSKEFLDWFRGQRNNIIKQFNLPVSKEFKPDEFMGVELKLKVVEK